MTLDKLKPIRKSGKERFLLDGKETDLSVIDFWQWCYSDLVSNTIRGALAEYIVARAIGVPLEVRSDWDRYDLKSPSGITIEVKSASYIQSWHQQSHSVITFGVRPTHGWDDETGDFDVEKVRQADVYVFCLLAHKDKSTVDPTNLDQWEFFVLPTDVLNRELGSQKTLSLSTLNNLQVTKCNFDGLGKSIENVAGR